MAAATALGAAAAPDLARVQALIIERTNDFRREQGRESVHSDRKLEAAARYFAEYMARNDRYGHEADGKTPADRAARHGYDHCLVAENISFQYSSEDFATADLARRYVEGWKKSPGHRTNMLLPAAQDTAVAVARSAKSGRYYAVQMFGRRKSHSVEFRIANHARENVAYRIGDSEYSLAPGTARIHTHCAPEELALAAPGATAGRMTPKNGDKLVVVRQPGGLALRPES